MRQNRHFMHVNVLSCVRPPVIQITFALIVLFHLSDRMLKWPCKQRNKECKVKQQPVSG